WPCGSASSSSGGPVRISVPPSKRRVKGSVMKWIIRAGEPSGVSRRVTSAATRRLTPLGSPWSFPCVALEPERRTADDLVRRDRRAHKFLDVRDNQLGPLEMADERRRLGIIHGVGHVAHQDHVLAVL